MLIIDRFEGDFAIVESGNGFINIPRSDIPDKAREGDVLIVEINESGTNARKERIENKAKRLFKD